MGQRSGGTRPAEIRCAINICLADWTNKGKGSSSNLLMTAEPSKRPNPMTRPIVIAVLVSFAIHLGGFGLWKAGNRLGWWKQNRFSTLVQKIGDKVLPAPKFAPKQNLTANEPPLMFIEVNPALAVSLAPKNAKLQGAVSTTAASPKQSEAETPQILGKQEEVLKLTDDAPPKALALQPTPKVVKPEPEDSEAKPPPENEGETVFGKAEPKTETKEITPETGKGKASETRKRPTTIAEAKKRSGTLGEKAKKDGGSPVIDLSSSMDVKGTPLGDYVAGLVEAVKQRWFQELDQVSATTPGKVTVRFRLHANGQVSEAKVEQTEVGELLSLICQKAVQDPSPYRPWPKELRLEMNSEYKDFSFTFRYLRN
jgi:hypothetical protein